MALVRAGIATGKTVVSEQLGVSCPKEYKVVAQPKGVFKGDCAEARKKLMSWKLFRPLFAMVHDHKIPEPAEIVEARKKFVARAKPDWQSNPKNKNSTRLQQRKETYVTTDLTIRVINMTPGKVNLSAHGDNSMTANNLGYNDCVDITGPAFTSENWFYVSMNPTMAEPQWSFSGLEWNYKNFGGYGNWQRLFGNGGKSCCTSTEWVAQARWWGVTVPDKGGIYTPMWGQLRGVLALDLHDNGTATWFNPSATKAGTYNSNVQFLAAFSPIRNYNNDQYAVFPLTSPSYQWSRTDCAQHYLTNRAFKGYPSEYLWSTKGSTSILPANLKPMAPLLKTLSINAKFCPGGGLSCTPLVFQKGTIEDSLFDGLIEAGMALSEAFASAIEAVYETLATMIEKNILSDSMVSDLATTGGDLEPMDLWSMTASSVRAEASALKSSGFSGRISVTGSSDSATLVNSYTEDMAVDDFYAAGPLDAAGEAAALEDVGSASVDDIATDMLIDILV